MYPDRNQLIEDTPSIRIGAEIRGYDSVVSTQINIKQLF